MFGFFKKDDQLKNLEHMFKGKILVEVLKTKIHRHKVFWVGRSRHDEKELRVGVEFSGGRRYFYDWNEFTKDARCSKFEILTFKEADELETKIKKKSKNRMP